MSRLYYKYLMEQPGTAFASTSSLSPGGAVEEDCIAEPEHASTPCATAEAVRGSAAATAAATEKETAMVDSVPALKAHVPEPAAAAEATGAAELSADAVPSKDVAAGAATTARTEPPGRPPVSMDDSSVASTGTASTTRNPAKKDVSVPAPLSDTAPALLSVTTTIETASVAVVTVEHADASESADEGAGEETFAAVVPGAVAVVPGEDGEVQDFQTRGSGAVRWAARSVTNAASSSGGKGGVLGAQRSDGDPPPTALASSRSMPSSATASASSRSMPLPASTSSRSLRSRGSAVARRSTARGSTVSAPGSGEIAMLASRAAIESGFTGEAKEEERGEPDASEDADSPKSAFRPNSPQQHSSGGPTASTGDSDLSSPRSPALAERRRSADYSSQPQGGTTRSSGASIVSMEALATMEAIEAKILAASPADRADDSTMDGENDSGDDVLSALTTPTEPPEQNGASESEGGSAVPRPSVRWAPELGDFLESARGDEEDPSPGTLERMASVHSAVPSVTSAASSATAHSANSRRSSRSSSVHMASTRRSSAALHLFDAQGHAMTEAEKVALWKSWGKCTKCGEVRTHKKVKTGPFKAFRKMKGITVQGRVYKGICLNCHELEEALQFLGESQSRLPGILAAQEGVAVLDDESDDSYNDQMINRTLSPKRSPMQFCLQNRRVQACLILAAVAIFATAIGIAINFTNKSGDDDSLSSATSDNGGPPDVFDAINATPTAAPQAPTPLPTASPSHLEWVVVGTEILSTLATSNPAAIAFGARIKLSDNGNRIAVSDPIIDVEGPNTGAVQIFDYIPPEDDELWWDGGDGRWTLVGKPIAGSSKGNFAGEGMDLSPDGKRVAVGYPGSDDGYGTVRVFEMRDGTNLTEPDWVQIGQTLNSTSPYDKFGASIALSKDGSIILIGVPFSSDGDIPRRGKALVYGYNSTLNAWSRVGQPLLGDNQGDEFGSSVDVTYVGTRIGVASVHNDGTGRGPKSGHIKTFQLQRDTGLWDEMGRGIWGDSPGDMWGNALSFGEDGDWLAAGAVMAEGEDSEGNAAVAAGHVRAFDWDPGIPPDAGRDGWFQLGFDIKGDTSYGGFGNDVMMSPDKSFIIASYKNKNSVAGKVKVFEEDRAKFVEFGDDIEGEITGPYQWFNNGPSVAMSRRGKRIAVGKEGIYVGGEVKAVVRVMSWSGVKS